MLNDKFAKRIEAAKKESQRIKVADDALHKLNSTGEQSIYSHGSVTKAHDLMAQSLFELDSLIKFLTPEKK
jgi:hypothetical protein